MEKRAGKRSVGVQTGEVPPKRLLHGASPAITEHVDVIGLCSESEGEFKGQPASDASDFMGSSHVSSCSLGQIPPVPQPGPTLLIANSYGQPLGEVNIGRLGTSNGSNTTVKDEDETTGRANRIPAERAATLYGPDRLPNQVSYPVPNSSEFLWVRSPPHDEGMSYRTIMEQSYPYEYDDGTLASFL